MQEKIKYFLSANIIGKKIIFFEEIESTQKEIKRLAEERVENGTIVIADYQTNGIGTHDRKWYSEKGKNISFSLVIYPKCKVKELEELTLDIAKCIVDTIWEIYGYKLEIKKPNDIIYNEKKMGGILTQIVTSGESIKYLLIGIGINVNGVNFPLDLQEIATSLKLEFNREFSREKIISVFCTKFEKNCVNKNII